MAIELEIKLTVSETAQARALDWLVRQPEASKGSAKTLSNRYYDTADAALNRARAALRVRQAGDRYIQTLKTQGQFTGGAHRREEWEWELASPELDLSLLARTPLAGQVDLAALQLVFQTNFQRQIVMLTTAESEIEVALDTGEVVGGGRSRPLHEVEFELKTGEPDELIRWAKALAGQVPVFLNLVSKAEQGYFLAGIYQPQTAVPDHALSVTEWLHTLSLSWLTGARVELPEPALQSLARAAEAAGLGPQWPLLKAHLQAGTTAARVIELFPQLGNMQLALVHQD
ncbi:MAG TPA: CYTH domain-containing protein [Marinobacter sp.]|nr:CYTH domain-containing protein [Marinobacter sp.]